MALALAALLALQQADEDISALLRLLQSKDGVISLGAEETLLELGPRAIPHLERAEKAAAGPVRDRLRRMIKDIREFEAGLESWETDKLPELLGRLDNRALHLQRRSSRKAGRPAHVAAVVERQYAEKLGATDPYALATYSFEFETRDRVKLVRNDWDFCFQQGQIYVRTVVDDRSEIWEAGADFEKLPLDGPRVRKLDERPSAAKGRVYVVHTDDTETDLWTKMQILEQRPGQWILFRWERITDLGDMMKLERTPDRLLKSGTIRLQVRSDGNPARLHLDGGKSLYLRRIATRPFDLDAAAVRRGESVGYVEGGLIPIGKVWVLRRVSIRANWRETGSFSVSVKGEILSRIEPAEQAAGKIEKTWNGRLIVRPGEERSVFAEVASSSQCDVTLTGAIWDEKFAEVEEFPELEGAEKARAERLVKALASDDIVTREEAIQDLIAWGPPVLGHLQRVDGSRKSPEFRMLLREVILKLGGD